MNSELMSRQYGRQRELRLYLCMHCPNKRQRNIKHILSYLWCTVHTSQEHTESADLQQGSSLPQYCPDSQFGESAIWCICSFTTIYPQTVIVLQALWESKRPLRLDRDPDHTQNLFICFYYHTRPLLKLLSQSIHNVFSYVGNRQTDRQKCYNSTIALSEIITSKDFYVIP